MTTVEDKLSLFSKIVFEKVEKQSEDQTEAVRHRLLALENAECARILKISDQILKEKVHKAEAASTRILSKARMEARQALLMKKKELLEATIQDVKRIAGKFVHTPEYMQYLENAIRQAIRDLDGEQQLEFYFTPTDMEAHEGLIRQTIINGLQITSVYTIHASDKAIIGGCLCKNGLNTRRVDATMASSLEDRRDSIGQIVMEHLSRTEGDEDGDRE